jgi:peptide/nickel transport system ATP-binding protein
MRSLCRSYGVAAVYVSHDLAVVSELVAEIAVMYAGRIVEAGAAPPLFSRPLHPYTGGLLASVPSPDGARRLTGIPGQQPAPGHRGPGCAFAPRCDLALDECRHHEPGPVLFAGRTVRCWRAAEATGSPGPGPAVGAASAAPRPFGRGGGVGASRARGGAVLSLRGVSASYGGAPVLSAIDLEVPGGSCVAIVGESGSGKTTLARCVIGLHRNWTGDISLYGVPLARRARDRPKRALKQIQCVFQNPYTSLNPRKTIGQIVAEPLHRFLGLSRAEQTSRVVAALDDVSLGGAFLGRYPDQLSGGERQRVAIARALVVEPDLLVCDEVTSALDVSVQAVIVELLRTVAERRHLAMIFITHNLALVRSVAQTAVVLRQGRIVEAGPAGQVLASPASEYTARLMADVPRLVVPGRPVAGAP